jgi:CheY-like chemotaxis protein
MPSLSLEQLVPIEKTILLVDDNAVQAAVRQAILRRSGYFVITALNPARALEQLRNGDFPSEVQLVVTDHIMPGMSGVEFVKEIRRFQPKIPILVISGMEEAAEKYEGLDVEFRVKPLPPENLLECVRELVVEAKPPVATGILSVVPPAR